jgi:flagellar basal body rod protein FlgF
VAPVDAPDDTRVIAEVDLTDGVVTRTHEPVQLNASNAIEIDGSNYDIETVDSQKRNDSDENATRISSDELHQVQLNESSIERGGDGTFTMEVEDDGETTTSEDIIRIDLSAEN